MAKYVVDFNGNITRKKDTDEKKKKKKARYTVDLNGKITENEVEEEDIVKENTIKPLQNGKNKQENVFMTALNATPGVGKGIMPAQSENTSEQGGYNLAPLYNAANTEKEEKEKKSSEKTSARKTENPFDKYKQYLTAEDFEAGSAYVPTKKKGFMGMDTYGDTTYEFINNEDYRNSLYAQYKGNKYATEEGSHGYDQMTSEEIAVYNYIYAKEGKKKAEEYLSDMEFDWTKRAYDAKTKEVEETADDGFLPSLGLSAASVITKPIGALGSAIAGLEEVLLGKEYNPYAVNRTLANVNTDARQYVGENIEEATEGAEIFGTNIPRFLYDTGMSAADSALGAFTLGKGYMAAAGVDAATQRARELYEDGATKEEIARGAIAAGAFEALFEKLSLENLIKPKNAYTAKQILKETLKQAGIEGSEEMATELSNVAFDSMSRGKDSDAYKSYQGYLDEGMSEAEARHKLAMDLSSQVLWAGIGGALAGGMTGGVSTAAGLNNTMTKNEQTVVDAEVESRIAEKEKSGKKLTKKEKAEIEEKVFEDLKEGNISIDKIESALGGRTYKLYNQMISENEERQKLNKIKNSELTGEQSERLDELRRNNRREPYEARISELKTELSDLVSNMTKDDAYIRESYYERDRKGQEFTADLEQYDEKQRATIQKAIDSKILNNTKKTHKFVDFVAKISADKGVSFDFTNNENLKNSGFAMEGVSVSGYVNVKSGDITLNINAADSLNKVVGHEITHVLEEADSKYYEALKEAVKAYAKTKGEYQTRYEDLAKLYENVENADIESELTADLIGDYLFKDEKFIKQLSVENRNIFQKIYDEIKYLVKVATAGTKEAEQLEKVKRLFEKAYKENVKKDTSQTSHGNNSLPPTPEAHPDAVSSTDSISQTKENTTENEKAYKENVSIPSEDIKVLEYTLEDSEEEKAAEPKKTFESEEFTAPNGVEVIKNPTPRQYNRITEEIYSGNPLAKDITFRRIYDENGNEYIWTAHKDVHDEVKRYINETIGARADTKYSIAEIRGNKKSYGTGVYLDTDLIEGHKPREWGKIVREHIYNMAGETLTIYNNGVAEEVYLAKKNDRVTKDGTSNSHKVIDKLARSKSGQNTRNLAVLHIDELAKTSAFLNQNDDNSHQWMDEKGWEHRKTYIQDKNGKIYEATLNIAKGKGRNILYDINNIKEIDHGAVPSQEVRLAHNNQSPNSSVTEKSKNATENKKFSLAGLNAATANNSLLLSAEHMLAAGVDSETVRKETGWYRGYDGKWRFEIDDSEMEIDLTGKLSRNQDIRHYQELFEKFVNGNITNEEMEDFKILDKNLEGVKTFPSMLGDMVKHSKLFAAYPELEDIKVSFEELEYGTNGKIKPYSGEIVLDKSLRLNKEKIKKTLIHEIQHAIQIIEGFEQGSDSRIQDVYRRSAGEIEARNVSDRLSYTERQRREIAPVGRLENVERDNVVFSGEETRFSLSAPVEETKDLLVLHNITENKLIKQLELSGFPMPSLAVTNQQHTKFGSISILFNKETIDPKKNKKNKIYSADAWTPTFPTVEYEANDEVEDSFRNTVNSLIDDEHYKKDVGMYLNDIGHYLDRHDGYEGLLDELAKKPFIQYAFLKSKGEDIQIAQKEKQAELGFSTEEKSVQRYEALIKEFGEEIDDLTKKPMKELVESSPLLQEMLENYPLKKPAARMNFISRLINQTIAYKNYDPNAKGGVEFEQDYAATNNEMKNRINKSELKDWLRRQTEGLVKNKGIRNEKEIYTPSGKRRSFQELHYQYNVENIVKSMMGQGEKSVTAFNGVKTLRATTAKTFKSIDEIIKSKGKLQSLTEEENKRIHEELSQNMYDVFEKILEENPDKFRKDDYMKYDRIGDILSEVGIENLNASYIKGVFKENYYNISSEVADDVFRLLDAISSMPVYIFEAKPQRVVGYDEIKAVIIPEDSNQELKEALDSKGIGYVEYDGTEADRQSKLNRAAIENNSYFSLSKQKDIAPTEGWNVRGEDIALNKTKEEDIAPLPDALNTTKEEWDPYENYDIEEDDEYEFEEENIAPLLLEQNLKENPEEVIFEEEDSNEDVTPFELAQQAKLRGEEKVEWEPYEDDLSIGPFTTGTAKEIAPVAQTKSEDNAPSRKKKTQEVKIENIKRKIKQLYLDRDLIKEEWRKDINKLETEFESLKSKHGYEGTQLLIQIEDAKSERNESIRLLDEKIEKHKKALSKAEEILISGTRKEHHANIMNNIKTKFQEKGFDFDETLVKAKDRYTITSVAKTPQRFMELTFGDEKGELLSDLTVNQTAQNETEKIRWLNSYTDRKNGLLSKLSEQYNIKPYSNEDAAAHMYGEGFYVNEAGDKVTYGDTELAKDFPDPEVQRNIKALAKDVRIRQTYDETLDKINESRKRNAYPEIPRRQDYFLHFTAMGDTFSKMGIPFRPSDIKAKNLPTDINGMTADLKPGQPYFASAQQRKGNRTTYSVLGGLERYLTSAANQIYHIDDIQTLRAMRNYIAETFGQAHGLDGLDEMTEEQAAERIKEVYSGHLSVFNKFLTEQANHMAGKTALIDRGVEGFIGREGIEFLRTMNQQVGSNMVGWNVRSASTNAIPTIVGLAKLKKKSCMLKAIGDTTRSRLESLKGKTYDDFAENSTINIRRKGAEKFARTPYEKVRDSGFILAGAVDDFTTEVLARAKYYELIKSGMKSKKAHFEADKWTARILGDRSYGQQAQLFNSQLMGTIFKFQYEMGTTWDSIFYDTFREARLSNKEIQNGLERNAKTAAKVASTLAVIAIGNGIAGLVFKELFGYDPTFNMAEILLTAIGWDDDEESEDTWKDNLNQAKDILIDDLPYVSTFTGGGKIPVTEALPFGELINGKDEYGNEKPLYETLHDALPYYILPTGANQIRKTYQGLKMFDDDLPIAGSYTQSGKLRFSVEDNLANRAKAAVFGQYASKEARQYFDEGRLPLSGKKTQELVDLDLPISEYWEIQDKLKGKKKLEEKADVIADLDLPIEKKNILINNATTRKEEIDLTDYDLYGDFEEFDFAQKKPEEYKISKAAGGYKNYVSYKEALGKIEADTDKNGKVISGSRKDKVINYINSLQADYGEKLILFKQQYPSDDTYNVEIVEYLNGRSDLSYGDVEEILKELGFTVKADGTVKW